MKSSRFLIPAAIAMFAGIWQACDDDVSQIGSSISSGEVSIKIDSLEYDLLARAVDNKSFDARSGTLLIGNIDIPQYGSLACSFVTRLLPISQFPDSMTVSKEKFNEFINRIDSCSLQLYLIRGNITGDSLAPQKATVYRLDKQIPNDLTNDYSPAGSYDPSSPLGSKSYTLANAGAPDKDYLKASYHQLNIPLGKEFAVELYKKYQSDSTIFQWPQSFAKYIPGLYVENTFGKGAVANYNNLTINSYFYTIATRYKYDDEGKQIKDENGNLVMESYHRKDSLVLCSSAPEVLSSNRIAYKPSKSLIERITSGEAIITTPGGYTVDITFPARELIKKYREEDFNLSIVSGLSMTIPADTVYNDFGITGAPFLLLIKSSEVNDFFAKNRLPDSSKASFYAEYNSTVGGYRFSGLREYLLTLLDKKEITDEDVNFSLIPVMITTETTGSSYYSQGTTYVTGCTPFTTRPTMTKLDTKNAQIVFTFSSQVIK